MIMQIRTSSEAQEKNWRQGVELRKPFLVVQAWTREQQLLKERHEAPANCFSSILPRDQKHNKLEKGQQTLLPSKHRLRPTILGTEKVEKHPGLRP